MSFEKEQKEYGNTYNLVHHSLRIDDVEDALISDLCQNEESEFNLRMSLLHLYNDIVRDNKNINFTVTQEEKAYYNQVQLSRLLLKSTNIGHKLFAAEIYREMGEFDMCEKLIKEIGSLNDYQEELRKKIYSQSKVRNKRVFEIKQIAIKKEYKCENCNDRLVLFDLSVLKSILEYRCFRCGSCAAIFNTPTHSRK